MTADINPEFKEANAAIEEAALVFVEKIVELYGKWKEVRPSYIIETALRELSELLSPVGDHLKPTLGPASLKLARRPGRLPGLGVRGPLASHWSRA